MYKYKKTYPDEPEQQPTSKFSAYAGPSCKYAEFVRCSTTGRVCETCGWNPDVAQARLQAFCDAHDITMPVR